MAATNILLIMRKELLNPRETHARNGSANRILQTELGTVNEGRRAGRRIQSGGTRVGARSPANPGWERFAGDRNSGALARQAD
jgi:hypothetical protein